MDETKRLETVRAGKFGIPILYLDNHLLGVIKPRNMPVQADESRDLDLLTALKGYVGEKFMKPGAVYLGLVHRLDRPVGGVMVFARTSKAAERLSRDFAGHDMEKRYLAVVKGELKERRALEDWLVKDGKTGMVRVCRPDEPGAKPDFIFSAKTAALVLMNKVMESIPKSLKGPEHPPDASSPPEAGTAPEKPVPVTPDNRVKASDLEKRLALLK